MLWLRQLKRYFRSRSRIIGSLGQPLLFLLALGYGLGPVFQQAGQGDYLSFLAPGIIGMSVIFTSMFFGIEIIWDRQFGFLKETLVAPVSRIYIMLGRTLGGATIATFQGVMVFGIAVIAGWRIDNWLMIIPAAGVIFLTALLFAAFGTAIAAKLEDMQGFQLIMNFIIMPLFFLSGALFPLDTVPTALRVIAQLNPLAYGIDALRALLLNTSHFGLGLDMLVLSCLTALFLLLGSWLFSQVEV